MHNFYKNNFLKLRYFFWKLCKSKWKRGQVFWYQGLFVCWDI